MNINIEYIKNIFYQTFISFRYFFKYCISSNRGWFILFFKNTSLSNRKKAKKYFFNTYTKVKIEDEADFEFFLLSLNNSSNRTRLLLNSYFIFLLFCIISSLSISAEDIFLNKGIKFFTFDISLTVYDFSLYSCFLIVFLHIFVIESIINHHKRVFSFIKSNFRTMTIEKKLLYIDSFCFNHISLYSHKSKGISFKLITFTQVLMFLPILFLMVTLWNVPYPKLNLVMIFIVGIFNVLLTIRSNIHSLTFIPQYFITILFLIYVSFQVFRLSDSKDNFTILPSLQYIQDIDINKYNSVESKSIYMKNRVIQRMTLKKVDISNSVFVNTDFNNVVFSDTTKLINNRYYNTYFNYVAFKNSIIQEVSIKGDYKELITYRKNRHKSKFYEVLVDDTKISNSEFINLKIINSQFVNSEIIKTTFINTDVINTTFNGKTILNSTFKNCTIENSYFVNLELKKVKFENCKFKFENQKEFEKSNIKNLDVLSTKTNKLIINKKEVKSNFL